MSVVRWLVGAVAAGLVWLVVSTQFQGALLGFAQSAASPFVVFSIVAIVGLGVHEWDKRAGRSVDELQRGFDGAIDQLYLCEHPTGITQEGREREHAPQAYRVEWYARYGLPAPKPHKARYR